MLTRKSNGVTYFLEYARLCGSRCEAAAWTTNRDDAWPNVPDHVVRAVRSMRTAR